MGRISFDDVLGTNYVPTHIERCSIKVLIESKEQELSSLNHDMSPLLQIAMRDRVADSILGHTALLAPVRRMPPELISEVFIRTINSAIIPDRQRRGKSKRDEFPRPRVNEEPLKLGRICRIWRDIALSTSSLWSAIKIPTGRNIEGLQEWISRSGSCTLSFTVQLSRENSSHLNLLASYQDRWKEVVFLSPTHPHDSEMQFAQEFLGCLAHNYACLHTLKSAYNLWEYDVPAQNRIRMVVDSAPNLHNLHLYAPIINLTPLNETRRFCLRKINIECAIPTGAFISLLRHFPEVESVFASISFSAATGDKHEILTLLSLKHLELRQQYDKGRGLCPLRSLHLPALEELSLDFLMILGLENILALPPHN